MRKKIRFLYVSLFIVSVFSGTNLQAQVSVGIGITAGIPPPPLPVYVQPACPVDGYLWIPGYWAYTNDGYFWVPGVWVFPPEPGFLWTPAYWEFSGGYYRFHRGYWGPHVGFYGGLNYGYGYYGSGFNGGKWQRNTFRYNTAVVNVNRTVVHNVYTDNTVIVRNNTAINNRISYNGGPHGIYTRPNTQEQSAVRERHINPTPTQTNHQNEASMNRAQYVSAHHSQPATFAMNRAGISHVTQPHPGQSTQGSAVHQQIHPDDRVETAPNDVTRGNHNPSHQHTNPQPQTYPQPPHTQQQQQHMQQQHIQQARQSHVEQQSRIEQQPHMQQQPHIQQQHMQQQHPPQQHPQNPERPR